MAPSPYICSCHCHSILESASSLTQYDIRNGSVVVNTSRAHAGISVEGHGICPGVSQNSETCMTLFQAC